MDLLVAMAAAVVGVDLEDPVGDLGRWAVSTMSVARSVRAVDDTAQSTDFCTILQPVASGHFLPYLRSTHLFFIDVCADLSDDC